MRQAEDVSHTIPSVRYSRRAATHSWSTSGWCAAQVTAFCAATGRGVPTDCPRDCATEAVRLPRKASQSTARAVTRVRRSERRRCRVGSGVATCVCTSATRRLLRPVARLVGLPAGYQILQPVARLRSGGLGTPVRRRELQHGRGVLVRTQTAHYPP